MRAVLMQTILNITLRAVKLIPLAIAVTSCASPTSNSENHLRTSYQQFNESYQAKFAEVDVLMKCVDKNLQLTKTAVENKDSATFDMANQQMAICPRPNGMRRAETINDYLDRIKDEWEERDCTYQAGFTARSITAYNYIKSQCLRDLELRRIRKELEKANKKQ